MMPPVPWRPRTSNSNSCASAYSQSARATSEFSASFRLTLALKGPGSVSLAFPNDSCAWRRRLAISAARSSWLSPCGTGRRTASATTCPVSPSAIAAAARRPAADPAEQSQPTSTRRNGPALIAATPSDGEPWQPCQPPLLPQPDRDRGHQQDSEPAVPRPRTGAGPAQRRASSPVAIVNAAVAHDKIRPLLKAGEPGQGTGEQGAA